VTKNNLQDTLTESSKNEILNSWDVSEFTSDLPHTICFFDDAINILKERKYLNLKNLLFQNRQPRFTLFICLQDFFSIPPQLKRNADWIWIFTGFTDKTIFGTLVRQIGSPISSDELWQLYNSLEYRDALIFKYSSNGIEIKNLFMWIDSLELILKNWFIQIYSNKLFHLNLFLKIYLFEFINVKWFLRIKSFLLIH
jgi:hypothetical protein